MTVNGYTIAPGKDLRVLTSVVLTSVVLTSLMLSFTGLEFHQIS